MDNFIAVFAFIIKVYMISPYVTSTLAPAWFRRFWLSDDGSLGTLSRGERIGLWALDKILGFTLGTILWGTLALLWFMYTHVRLWFDRP